MIKGNVPIGIKWEHLSFGIQCFYVKPFKQLIIMRMFYDFLYKYLKDACLLTLLFILSERGYSQTAIVQYQSNIQGGVSLIGNSWFYSTVGAVTTKLTVDALATMSNSGTLVLPVEPTIEETYLFSEQGYANTSAFNSVKINILDAISYMPLSSTGSLANTSLENQGGNHQTILDITSIVPVVEAGTIDCSKTQIYPAPVVGTPQQKTVFVTINVTTAGCFSPLSISGSGFSLANGVSQICTTTTGVQQIALPVNYDGSTLSNLNFTIGSAGSCTADLTKSPKKAIVDMWTLDCIPTQGPSLK